MTTTARSAPTGMRSTLQDVLHHPSVTKPLLAGLPMLLFIVILALVGPLFVDPADARIGGLGPRQAPSTAHLLGTDAMGRDLWTYMVIGLPNTLKVAFLAGFVGTGVGLFLALVAGFFGGWLDRVIRVVTDSLMTVPGIAILLIIAANVEQMTIELMALTIASLAWMFPARIIRAQVLSIRERAYIEVARANGVGPLGLIFREVLPNLMPFVAASFAGAVSGAILAAIGLEALGLGAVQSATVGMTIYWSQHSAAVLRGLWWWWAPPIAVIAYIFVSLFLISVGLDRIANPRLRRG